ncbi:hypothetical protein NH286_07685 [Anaerococcus sp. NML200574]|uniref:hypothetical protein n=1 Tax=Anaerococcus sp. NML200574 TaxID=2954486 RepID=UPI002236F770|nr:hypothetical protein [Anaerococcus sp. NML200574]MCW6679035.1 hypothetical protein [Anaerococcus sp. NML200574]
MKNKVSILEVVATKIIIAILIAGYYWLWSRSDYQPEYQQFSSYWGFILFLMLIVHYFRVKKYKKEYFDEFAEKNLHRCDSICLKIFCVLMVIIAYLGGILGHVNGISTALMGWLIIGTVITITILRTIMFIIMDSKGV